MPDLSWYESQAHFNGAQREGKLACVIVNDLIWQYFWARDDGVTVVAVPQTPIGKEWGNHTREYSLEDARLHFRYLLNHMETPEVIA